MALRCAFPYAELVCVSPGAWEKRYEVLAKPGTHILTAMDQGGLSSTYLKEADESQNLLDDEGVRDHLGFEPDPKHRQHRGYKDASRVLVFVLPWVLSLILFSLLLHAHWVNSRCASTWGRLELGK